MPNHYINSTNRDTVIGNCIYEIHYKHGISKTDNSGGWSIRFVESRNTPEGRVNAIDAALEDVYQFYPEALLEDEPTPIMTSCTKHKSWKWLRDQRKLGYPKNNHKPSIRGAKVAPQLQMALDAMEKLGII
jgi:hypothetical protein